MVNSAQSVLQIKRKKMSSCLLILAAGISLGFVVQYRKYEKGNDDLFNLSFFILILTAIACVALAWILWRHTLQYVFNKPPEKARRQALESFLPLLTFFLYPLFGSIPLGIRFKAVILIVGVISSSIAIGHVVLGRERRKRIAVGEVVLLLLIGGALIAAAVLGNATHNLQKAFLGKHESQTSPPSLKTISLDQDVRSTLTVDPLFYWQFDAKLRRKPFLVFSLAELKDSDFLDAYFFVITVESPDTGKKRRIEPEKLFEHTEEKWHDFIISLDDFENQRIHATFQVRPNLFGGAYAVLEDMAKRYLFSPAWNWSRQNVSALTYMTSPRIIHGLVNDDDYNIILISLDTLASHSLNLYGYSRETAPNLASLSREGILFTNVFSPATWTLPAHMSLFTSLYPSAHKIHSQFEKVKDFDFQTLAELLKTGGYYNAALPDGGFVSSEYDFNKGFDMFCEKPMRVWAKVDEAISWIEKHKELKFFLFIHTYEIHSYVGLRPEHKKFFGADYDGRIMDHFQKLVVPQSAEREALGFLPEDVRFIKDLYDGSIRLTDENLERLFQALRDMGVYDKTMIIVTSDHGESFGQSHDNEQFAEWGHANIPYENQIRVPLIVKMPQAYDISNRVVGTNHSLLDIMPTLADMLDLSPKNRLQGFSWMPELTGAKTEGDRRPIVSLLAPHRNLHKVISIRVDGFKYILRNYNSPKMTKELYNLVSDPYERKNLAGDDSFESEMSKYDRMLEEHLKECEKQGAGRTLRGNISKDLKKRLEALGYLQ